MYESNQEVFNTVAEHLLRQGAKSGVPSSFCGMNRFSCRYRAPDGKRCAIGICVPDDVYSENWENTTIRTVAKDDPLRYAKVFGTEVSSDLLEQLQECHDEFAVEAWPTRLRTLARYYNLQLPPSLAATAPSEQPVTTISA